MDIDLLLDGLSWALLLTGSVFAVIGGIGLLRMPDVYTRMHAASLTDTMAPICILAGLMIQGGLTLVSVKLLLILLFLLFTSPVAAHALSAAALGQGHKPLLARADGGLELKDVEIGDPRLEHEEPER